eukprot:135710_1
MGATLTLKVTTITILVYLAASNTTKFRCQHYTCAYGAEEAQCNTDIIFCNSWQDGDVVYRANVTVQEISGPTKERSNYRDIDADQLGKEAVEDFFDSHHNDISCNCFANEARTVDGCDINIKACFRNIIIYSTSLCNQIALKYETWITEHSYTGHYCCDGDRDVSMSMALEDLKVKNPGCFTPNPTPAPTSTPSTMPSETPTADPTIQN